MIGYGSRCLGVPALSLFLLLFSSFFTLAKANPTTCDPPDVLLVVDYSGSMAWGLDGDRNAAASGKMTKIKALRQAYQVLLTQFNSKIRFGLVSFTTETANGKSCAVLKPDVRLRVPVGPNTAQRCIAELNSSRPDGCTPVIPALEKAYTHFRDDVIPKDSLKSRRRFVVLLTDGVANAGCPGWKSDRDSVACRPYMVQRILKLRSLASGGKNYDIKTYVIGFGKIQTTPSGTPSMDPGGLNQMAQAGGTGKYFQADNLQQLQSALNTIANNAGNTKEICNNKDDNCNGLIDENVTETCQGACGSGTKICNKGSWSACSAPATKGKEVCNNKDDDCDGIVDNGLTRDCPATQGCGKAQKATCIKGQWVGCSKQNTPQEVCNNKDDDCDGEVDEGVTRPCKTACGTGTQACVQGDWSTCSAPQPAQEICNGRDDNCDGKIDDNPTCNGKCIGGVCHRICNGNECPSGHTCAATGICVEKTCDTPCGNGQRCLYGRCVPTDCRLPGGMCRAGHLCQKGACVKDPCIGVKCGKGSFCRGGSCRPTCDGVACTPSQVCVDGQCVENLCAGKNCAGGEVCYQGTCVANAGCPGKACGGTQVCQNGACVEDLCAGVTCPETGQICRDGQCFGAKGQMERDPKTGQVYPRGDKPGTTEPPGTQPPTTNPPGNTCKNGNCPPTVGICSIVQKNGSFPLFLLLFLLLPFVTRRK